MISTPLLLSLLAAFEPSPLDLLETGLLLEWSELRLMSPGGGRVLIDGDPVMISDGRTPLPPWGSFGEVRILSPLQAGVWGGGDWTVEFVSVEVPDSSYRSVVGLLENTSGRNRYTGILQRPLPLGMGASAALGREDTVSTQLLRLSRGALSLDGFLWQGSDAPDGYTAGIDYGAGGLRASCGLVSPAEGSRLLEAAASFSMHASTLLLEAAGGAAAMDSLGSAEAHLKASMETGSTLFVLRGDLGRDSSGTSLAGTAGIMQGIGSGPVLGAAWAGTPGNDGGLLATMSWGPVGAEFGLSGGKAGAGMHISWPGWLRLSGFASDSLLRASIAAFPGFRYGRGALVSLGGRLTATELREEGDGETSSGSFYRADLCTSLRLGGFSLVGSMEDIFDDEERRASYGIIWQFSDPPAWRPAEEERGS